MPPWTMPHQHEPLLPVVLAFGIPALMFGLGVLWQTVRDNRDQALVVKSLSWPETHGTILSADLNWANVKVTYEYRISGKRFLGTYRLSLGPLLPIDGATSGRYWNKRQSEFPHGHRVIIRYNPAALRSRSSSVWRPPRKPPTLPLLPLKAVDALPVVTSKE